MIGHTGGGGISSIAIPNAPELEGVIVFDQRFVYDAKANGLGVVATNSLRLTPR